MKANVAQDLRAIIVMCIVGLLREAAIYFGYPTIALALLGLLIVLFGMFCYKLYHQHIAKDYVSKYDKIDTMGIPGLKEQLASIKDGEIEENK